MVFTLYIYACACVLLCLVWITGTIRHPWEQFLQVVPVVFDMVLSLPNVMGTVLWVECADHPQVHSDVQQKNPLCASPIGPQQPHPTQCSFGGVDVPAVHPSQERASSLANPVSLLNNVKP